MSTTVAAESQIVSRPELPGGSAITPANLLRMPDGKNYELIDGEDYLRAGVKLIWAINPETRTLQVYYPDGTSRRLHEGDDVSGDNVIPGFRCSVAMLFPAAPEVHPATTVSPSA